MYVHLDRLRYSEDEIIPQQRLQRYGVLVSLPLVLAPGISGEFPVKVCLGDFLSCICFMDQRFLVDLAAGCFGWRIVIQSTLLVEV